MRSKAKVASSLALMLGLVACDADHATLPESESPYNIAFGTVRDSRDAQTYATVTIHGQTWMAQNLNYAVDSSWCYDYSADSCKKYGRLYQWSAAMGLSNTYNSSLWSGTSPHQGICPSGWHVPTDTEWGALISYVAAYSGGDAGNALKSTSGWKSSWGNGNGSNRFGFDVLPSSYEYPQQYNNYYYSEYYGTYYENSFGSSGEDADFWTASQDGRSGEAWERSFSSWSSTGHAYLDKDRGYSLRCLKD